MIDCGDSLIFTRRCSRSDIIIGIIAVTVLWVVLIAIGLNVAEAPEAQLMATGILAATYLLIVIQFVMLTSTAVYAIIIQPDHTLEFRYANPKFDQRIDMQDIITIYRRPLWESLSHKPRLQWVYQPGLTYIIHRNGYIALGKIHYFRAYRDFLRVIVSTNPNIAIDGL